MFKKSSHCITGETRIDPNLNGARMPHALIGQGGMGELYQPRDTKLDRDVALKV